MFIRTTWLKRPGHMVDRKDLKRIVCPPRRPGDDLGVPAPDFVNMTKGLFDRLG